MIIQLPLWRFFKPFTIQQTAPSPSLLVSKALRMNPNSSLWPTRLSRLLSHSAHNVMSLQPSLFHTAPTWRGLSTLALAVHCLKCSGLADHTGWLLLSFRYRFKCYLLRQTFPDHLIKRSHRVSPLWQQPSSFPPAWSLSEIALGRSRMMEIFCICVVQYSSH